MISKWELHYLSKHNLVTVCNSIYLSSKFIMFCSKNNGAVMEMFKRASVYFVRGAMRRCVFATDSVCVHMSTSAANSHSALFYQILHLSEYSMSSVTALQANPPISFYFGNWMLIHTKTHAYKWLKLNVFQTQYDSCRPIFKQCRWHIVEFSKNDGFWL